jgi:hypothetical protein
MVRFVFDDRTYKYVIAVLLAMNVALWCSDLFLVFRIELYTTRNRFYLAMAWAVIFPLSFACVEGLIYWGVTKHLTSQKAADEEHSNLPIVSNLVVNEDLFDRYLPRLSVILIEVCSFGFVCAYFWATALPLYNTPVWNLNTTFEGTLQPRQVALFGGYNDAVSAWFGSGTCCYFPQWTQGRLHQLF